MATYVLVPGAWLGGWAWDDVADRLETRGHEAHPVTLTGLGDRAPFASPDVDLERHIGDIVDAIEEADLSGLVLVGHSYGGIPVTGAADRIPERIATVVYVDSGPALDGTAYIDTLPPPSRRRPSGTSPRRATAGACRCLHGKSWRRSTAQAYRDSTRRRGGACANERPTTHSGPIRNRSR